MAARLLCRFGFHQWRPPTQWITWKDADGYKIVKGVEKCRRVHCRAVRDYYKSWKPKMTSGRK